VEGHIRLYENGNLTYDEKYQLILQLYSETRNAIYLTNEANPENELNGEPILSNFIVYKPIDGISQNEFIDSIVNIEIYYNTALNKSTYLITITEKMYALLSITNTLEG
jgi:hypothetical protein